MYGIIYKATCISNNKSYVGQTIKTLEDRIRRHIKYASMKRGNDYFHSAIRKYGIENFKWEILCECETKEILNLRETMKIIVEQSHWTTNGYNLTWGGDGSSGLKHTEASKKKISDANKGGTKTLEQIKRTTETIIRNGALVGDKNPTKRPEVREKIRQSKLGRTFQPLSEEVRKKIGKKNRKYSDEIRELARKYKDDGLCCYQISKIMGMNNRTIWLWLAENN